MKYKTRKEQKSIVANFIKKYNINLDPSSTTALANVIGLQFFRIFSDGKSASVLKKHSVLLDQGITLPINYLSCDLMHMKKIKISNTSKGRILFSVVL